ncbi:VQ domain-containing protein [Heracleum sosnowskyi]|uniref:VQ domain-containing protein n=1 Tax=Heracleum sosnowskyi TaxID=360622 RepID=A0AAD8MFT5_9APIA|nr:VQ domain-containing protein [Heracleum sosnowskyi]
MNSSYNFSGKSPRKEIQGPRPTPLQVRKDSHMIRKPPVNVSQQVSQSHSHRQHPPPVIIYTLSPRVYHVEPTEFMQLVQRLTGRKGEVGQSSSAVSDNNIGVISPAARLAATEYVDKLPRGKKEYKAMGEADIGGDIDEITDLFPGILSPPPSSLPPIPQDFFAQSSGTIPLESKSYMDRHDRSSAPTPTHSNNSFSPKIMAYSPDSQDYFINFYDI